MLAISALSGLYTSAWGAYKDGPWEGFHPRTFPRSVLFSVGLAALVALTPVLGPRFLALPLFHVFFLVMGLERMVTEVYKACFRDGRDPARFHIPQGLTFFGRDVESRPLRRALGVAGLGAIALVLALPWTVRSLPAFVAVAAVAGLLVSLGGAYKDAPFEGFQPLKFFRSSLVLALVSPLIWRLGPLPLGFALFLCGGIERLLVEYYKSFVVRSVPGKFRADLPTVPGPYLSWRPRLHVVALALVGVAVAAYWVAS